MKCLNRIIVCLFVSLLFIIPCGAGDVDSPSENYSIKEASLSFHELAARNAAVRVETKSGFGSGTYVTIGRRRVVITAAHVVKEYSEVSIHGNFGESVFGDVIYLDPDNDFAIISVGKLNTRKPVKFIPTKRKFKDLLGMDVVYSGFPGHHNLLTLRGKIAGKDRGYLILQSYAWMGASGSGVFDLFGNFVGVLVAVDVGKFDGHHHVVESVVWIVPIDNIEMRLIRSILVEKIPL